MRAAAEFTGGLPPLRVVRLLDEVLDRHTDGHHADLVGDAIHDNGDEEAEGGLFR